MKNEDIRPKTVVSNRGYLEQELIDNIVNSEGFQRAVDYHQDNMVEDVKVTYNLKKEKKPPINISHNEITREVISQNVNSEVEEMVRQSLKRKDRVDDVSGYSYSD